MRRTGFVLAVSLSVVMASAGAARPLGHIGLRKPQFWQVRWPGRARLFLYWCRVNRHFRKISGLKVTEEQPHTVRPASPKAAVGPMPCLIERPGKN